MISSVFCDGTSRNRGFTDSAYTCPTSAKGILIFSSADVEIIAVLNTTAKLPSESVLIGNHNFRHHKEHPSREYFEYQ